VAIVSVVVALILWWWFRRRDGRMDLEEEREPSPAEMPQAPVASPLVETELPAAELTPTTEAPAAEKPSPVEPPHVEMDVSQAGVEPETAQGEPPKGGPEPVDLTLIAGIDDRTSDVLRAGGVTSFARLALMKVGRLQEILTEGHPDSKADPTSWPHQAALAAGARWDELQAYQDELQGDTKPGPEGGLPERESPAGGRPPQPDDLERIEGIGPRISSLLNEAGITTFAELSSMAPERIREVLTEHGLRAPVNPDTWPQQAALAAAAKWDELTSLQGELQGGRRV
jgi:predicted flap endonuclease-1-like 5' DNA nuclease